MTKYEKKYQILQLDPDGTISSWFREYHYKRVYVSDHFLYYDSEEEALEEAGKLELSEFLVVPLYREI